MYSSYKQIFSIKKKIRSYFPPRNLQQFRREIVHILLTRYETTLIVGSRPSTSISSVSCNRVSDDVRYDGKSTLLFPPHNKKKKICR